MRYWRSIFSTQLSVVWDCETNVMLRFSGGTITYISISDESSAVELAKLLKLVEVSASDVPLQVEQHLIAEIKMIMIDIDK